MAVLAIACSDSTVPIQDPVVDDGPDTIEPGSTLPLDEFVRLEQSGTYVLMAETGQLITRCFGKAVLTFTSLDGFSQMERCEAPFDSLEMITSVHDVPRVMYEIPADDFAHVLARRD